MRTLIIDDEPLAAGLLAAYAERSPDLDPVTTFTNPIEALHHLQEHGADLIFLDVQMPELTGLQFMQIAKGDHQIILTTAYEEYALKGYEFSVTDYLLKPISLDRFLLSVEKAKERITASPAPGTAPASAPEPPARDYLFVKSGHKMIRVAHDDILRLEGMSNYVMLHTSNERIMTLENLTALVASLPAERFVRVHRSHAVALEKIDYVERNRIVIGEDRIPISEKYREPFLARIT